MNLRRLLVALDLSPASMAALNRARKLVERAGSLHLLHVVDSTIDTTAPRYSTPEEMERYRIQLQDEARARLEQLAKTVTEPDVVTEIEIGFGNPADEILATSTRIGADLVAVGAHGKNVFDRMVLGSVAEEIARKSLIPTLVVREPPSHSTAVDRVVVALDLQETSGHAAGVASVVARRLGVPIEALHVVDVRDLPLPLTGAFDPNLIDEETRRRIAAAPHAVERALIDAGVGGVAIRVLGGMPGVEITSYVTDRDLLVCGTHGRGAVGRFLFGSVAMHVLRHSPCPVLIVRRRAVDAAP